MKTDVYRERKTVWSSFVNPQDYATKKAANEAERRNDLEQIKLDLLKNRENVYAVIDRVHKVIDQQEIRTYDISYHYTDDVSETKGEQKL